MAEASLQRSGHPLKISVRDLLQGRGLTNRRDPSLAVIGRLESGPEGHLQLSSDGASIRIASTPVGFNVGDWIESEFELRESSGRREILLNQPVLRQRAQREARSLPPELFQAQERFQNLTQKIRDFFRGEDFTEARTPSLVVSPGLEVHLEPFQTSLKLGRQVRDLYLPTSPEFHLKKMLSHGWTRIFEMKECFRNGEISDHHQPEFLMLEWYRSFESLEKISQDVVQLLEFLSRSLGDDAVLRVQSIRHRSMSELFRTYLNFELTPATSKKELEDLFVARNALRSDSERQPLDSSDSWNDIFFRLFLDAIEPHLGPDGILDFVWDFPPSQAALACMSTDGWAQRFEVYWQGLELANAYQELTDPDEQVRRFEKDLAEKQRLGLSRVPVDPDFIQALQEGLPPAAGIALGVDRLAMALWGYTQIRQTRVFSLE